MVNKLDASECKKWLMKIYPSPIPFSLEFSPRITKTRYGSYSHGTRKIRIYYKVHNRSINEVLITVIHEYAHHIQYAELDAEENGYKPHGKEFRQILYTLITIAVQKSLFKSDLIEDILQSSL